MEMAIGAKSTKPGSKANAKRNTAMVNGKPPRVPVGALHIIDLSAQGKTGSMYDAVCGETGLMSIDGDWHDEFSNERCQSCSDHQWMAEFGEMQAKLLPK